MTLFRQSINSDHPQELHMSERTADSEAGASSFEYVGITLVAAIVVGSLAVAVAPGSIGAVVTQAVCSVVRSENCPPADAPSKPPSQRTWLEKATWGQSFWNGDSLASGEGAGNYIPGTDETGFDLTNPLTWNQVEVIGFTPDGIPVYVGITKRNMCHQSTKSYQAVVFEQLKSEGYFPNQEYSTAACSGATVEDLYSNNAEGNDVGPQAQSTPAAKDEPHLYDKVPADASLIGMSMGGNDVGFGGVLTKCVTGVLGSVCGGSGDQANNAAADKLLLDKMDAIYGTGEVDGTGLLEKELASLKAQHPDARIIIMGYPQLFAERGNEYAPADTPYGNGSYSRETHSNKTDMSVAQQAWANRQSVLINAHIKAMCERVGVEFVDPSSLFVGPGYDHRAGSDEPWINSLSFGSHDGSFTMSKGSFHPNESGHAAEAGLLLQYIKEGPK
jgi:hypothetical protein